MNYSRVLTGRLLDRLPRTLGGRCLLGLFMGVAMGLAFPRQSQHVAFLGSFFIRASQIITMPYMIFELLGALGGIGDRSLKALSRAGGASFLLMLCIGASATLFLPSLLPTLLSSAFFNPTILEPPQTHDILDTFLPYNVFSAMSADNFPAVAFFTVVMAIILQGLPERDVLLRPIGQLRILFSRLNGLVARITPFGIFALVAVSISELDGPQLVILHALPVIVAIGIVLVSIAVFGLIISVTPFTFREIWSVVKGPLAITASSANLMIALPMLIESTKKLFAEKWAGLEESKMTDASEQVSALIPIGFALPSLGEVVLLVFVPFLAWFSDRPLTLSKVMGVIATGIPEVLGGIHMAVQQGILRLSLPRDLINIFVLNGEWVYRTEKTLSLLGIVLLVFLVVSHTTGNMRIRPWKLLATFAIIVSLAIGSHITIPRMLGRTLAGTYRNDRILKNLMPAVDSTRPVLLTHDLYGKNDTELSAIPVRSSVLDSIQSRGVLRVGLRTGACPWVYRNASGQLVGYDIDLVQALARSLDVRVELITAPGVILDTLVAHQQVDIALGGIVDGPRRSPRIRTSQGYQAVHLALVVRDHMVRTVESPTDEELGTPLRIALTTNRPLPTDLQHTISSLLGRNGVPRPVTFTPIGHRDRFLEPEIDTSYDALLSTAEAGASFAVLHPSMTMTPVFGKQLPTSLVIVTGMDPALSDYIDDWIGAQQQQDLFIKLFRHWVMVDQ